MGKKYIVEIGRLERLYKAHINGNGMPNITWLSPEVDLTPYTEPDMEQVRKEMYDKGYDDAAEEKYNDGLADAWDAVRKIANMDSDEREKIFGEIFIQNIQNIYSASEVIEKIRQYEQEKKEIQVGDEVENTQTGVKFIVTHLWKNNRGEQGVSGFNRECSAFSTTLSLVVKTGRHFPELVEVLQKMKETE